jgi:hypothetical protein
VQLSLNNGRVTLAASNATVRQILMEWARIGQTRIVNVERIPGGPVTLQLTNVPEQEALDILLRSVTGYMAAPRPLPVANLSRYDRILVLATAAAARVPVAASPTPVFQQPGPGPSDEQNDDNQPSVGPPRGPLFPTLQQQGNLGPNGTVSPGMQPAFPVEEQRGTPSQPFVVTSPGAPPIGTPRPGMVLPIQPQPGQLDPGQQEPPPPQE